MTIDEEVEVARKRRGLGITAINRELRDLDRDRANLDARRARLLTARAALEDEALVPSPRPRRISREEVTEYLRGNPGSTTSQVAEGMGVKPTTVAQHLSRGGKDGLYRYESGKWSVIEE